jgi:hypothetical protein
MWGLQALSACETSNLVILSSAGLKAIQDVACSPRQTLDSFCLFCLDSDKAQ